MTDQIDGFCMWQHLAFQQFCVIKQNTRFFACRKTTNIGDPKGYKTLMKAQNEVNRLVRQDIVVEEPPTSNGG